MPTQRKPALKEHHTKMLPCGKCPLSSSPCIGAIPPGELSSLHKNKGEEGGGPGSDGTFCAASKWHE